MHTDLRCQLIFICGSPQSHLADHIIPLMQNVYRVPASRQHDDIITSLKFQHSSQLSTVKRCHTSGTRLANREEQHASTCLINSFSLAYLYRPTRQTTHTMSKLMFAMLSRMLTVCLQRKKKQVD